MSITKIKSKRTIKKNKNIDTKKLISQWEKLRDKVSKEWDNKLSVLEEIDEQRKN